MNCQDKIALSGIAIIEIPYFNFYIAFKHRQKFKPIEAF